jgi:hypothetical protein
MGYRLPVVKQMHATMPGGLRFLRMGEDETRVAQMMPAASVQTVRPDATDVGMSEPTRVAVYDTYLNGNVQLADDDAYRIVAALHGQWMQLQSDYSLLVSVAPNAVAPVSNPHPYHEGAIRYFREAGLWSAEHQRNQDRLTMG